MLTMVVLAERMLCGDVRAMLRYDTQCCADAVLSA